MTAESPNPDRVLPSSPLNVPPQETGPDPKREDWCRLEEAARLSDLGLLVPGIAHALSNLLGTVLGFTDLALDSESAEFQQTCLESIRSGAERFGELAHRLKRYAGRPARSAPRVDLASLLLETAHLVEPAAARRSVSFRVEAAGPCWAAIDSALAHSLVLGIFAYCFETSAKGDVIRLGIGQVEIEGASRTEPSAERPDRGELEGPRTNTTLFAHGVGAGHSSDGSSQRLLRLERLASAAGGTLRIESVPAAGIRLCLQLGTIEVGAVPSTALASCQDPLPPRNRGSIRDLDPTRPGSRGGTDPLAEGCLALVADDEESVRELCSLGLERLGFQVLTAPSVAAALQVIRDRGVSLRLVLSDVVFADGSGREVLAAAHVDAPQAATLLSSGLDAAEALGGGEGQVTFLAKPYSRGELERSVREALRRVSR